MHSELVWKYFGVGHATHTFMNPMATARFEALIDMLELPESARTLDIACGKAAWLIRLARRYPTLAGVGVDRSAWEAPVARARVAEAGLDARITIIEGDGAAYEAPPASFDLTSCLGASWIWHGHRGTLAALRRWTRPGGLVVVGEPHWRQPPAPAYLAMTQLGRDDFADGHAANVLAGEDLGLTPLYATTSTLAEWDDYEWQQQLAIERWARANPDDPDRPALVARARAARDEYLTHGRDTLGWGIYVFRVPPA